MLRDYRKGQRLSGATIKRLSLANWRLSSDYRTDRRDYSNRISDYSATIQRLFRDYWKRAARENRAAFLIANELAVANQWGKAHS